MMNEDVDSRRFVLRGALAIGCGLWVPIVISGCDSSKQGERTTGAPTPGAPATAATASAPATAKVAKSSVQYQPQPRAEQKCSACMHFIAESSTCKLVDGQISPDGWCSLWMSKG